MLQLTQHAALDQANEGFIAALDDSGIAYDADQQNASNDQNACQTIEQLSIDYMLPAEISFPENLKRVGIVNNMPDTPENRSPSIRTP